MGSQTLEILRQGVWASLTGGWFYDPHQDVFSNTFHLYIWLFLLCLPFTIYVYFPPTQFMWYFYCASVTVAFTVIKIVNFGLHYMYDTTESIREDAEEEWNGQKREDEGIEMQVFPTKPNEEQQARAEIANFRDENDSLESTEFQQLGNADNAEKPSSTIDLKAEVHRKNSSESSEVEVVLQTYDQSERERKPKRRPKHQRSKTDGFVYVPNDVQARHFKLYQQPGTESQDGLLNQHRPSLQSVDSEQSSSTLTETAERRHSNFTNSSLNFLPATVQAEIKPTGSVELGYIDKNSHLITPEDLYYNMPSRVRRIRSTALETCCPPAPLAAHPNSLEVIGCKSTRNPLPPPSTTLIRNQHLNLCPYFGSEIVYPIAEQSDEHQTSHGPDTDLDSMTHLSDSDYEDQNQGSHSPLIYIKVKRIKGNVPYKCERSGKASVKMLDEGRVDTSKEVLGSNAPEGDCYGIDAAQEKMFSECSNSCSNTSVEYEENERRQKRKSDWIGASKSTEFTKYSKPDLICDVNETRIVRKRNARRNKRRKQKEPEQNCSSLVDLNLDCLFDDENTGKLQHRKEPLKRDEWSSTITVSLEHDVSKVLQETVPAARSLGAIPKKSRISEDRKPPKSESEKCSLCRCKTEPKSLEETSSRSKENKVTQTLTSDSPSPEGLECIIYMPKNSGTSKKPAKPVRTKSEEASSSSSNNELSTLLPPQPLLSAFLNTRRHLSSSACVPGGFVDGPNIAISPYRSRLKRSRVNRRRNKRDTAIASSLSAGYGTHSAKNFNDTSDGSVHCFLDEHGNWITYTFDEKGIGTANTRLPETQPKQARRRSDTAAARKNSTEVWDSNSTDSICNSSVSTILDVSVRKLIIHPNQNMSTAGGATGGRFRNLPERIRRLDQNFDALTIADESMISIVRDSAEERRPNVYKTMPAQSYVKDKSYYKFKLLPWGFIKITFDRLKLMALLDRNLTMSETFLSIVLGVLVSVFGAKLLYMNFYEDLLAFIFCFVIASCQYSLLKSVQPDAASPTHGFNRVIAYSRPIYFCLTSLLAIIFHYNLNEETIRKGYKLGDFGNQQMLLAARDFLIKFILFFPLLFSLGLFPQINTFVMYLLEQIDMHFFGGNAMSSLSASFYCVFRSIMAVIILAGFAFGGLVEPKGSQHVLFSIFCATLVACSYHLSRSASDPSHIWNYLKKHLWPTDLYREHGKAEENETVNESYKKTSEQKKGDQKDVKVEEGKEVEEHVDPLPQKLQKTVNARIKNDVILCCLIAILVFAIHASTVFTVLQPELGPVLWSMTGTLGFILHYIIPQLRKQLPWLCVARPILRSHEHHHFQINGPAKIMWFEALYVYFCFLEKNILYPLVFLCSLTVDSPKIASKFGTVTGSFMVVVFGLKCLRNSYSDPSSQFLILTFTALFLKFDYVSLDSTFLMDYFFMGIVYQKTHELLLKIKFVVTYIAPWQITWGSAFHAFAQPFSVPHSAMLFLQAFISSVLSTPLNPFLGSAIFLTSYVRPVKFWERDYNTRRVDHSNTPLSSHLDRNVGADDNNLNSIFYEHLTRSLQHSLCGDLILGRWGNVNQGDCFVLASDYLNCLVHIIELGNGLVTFQMRGLEFRGTYCQQREVEAITEGVEDNDGCCCCDTGRIPNMLSVNAAFSQRWLAWEVTASKYILEGYSISDNSAVSMLHVFEFRKVLVSYYVKSIIFYTIRSPKLEEWLSSQTILKALQPMEDRRFVDLDPVFDYNIDEDFDIQSGGMTKNMFVQVHGDWITFCTEKAEKNIDSSPKSTLVLLCFALSLLGRRTLGAVSHNTVSNVEFFLYGLHALFKGDFRITCARDEWVFSDMDLLRTVVAPGVRMSLKLHQDHFMSPDEYEELPALFEAICNHQEELVISHEGDPAWRTAVLSGTPSLLALRHVVDDGSDEYKIIMLNKRYLSFRVIKVNKECVRGLWAGQQQELVYLRNRNPERGSIQNAKQALRNIINSSCDQPIGYPIYVSPLTTSYADTNEQYCSLVGGSISLTKIKNYIINTFRRIRKRCGEGCSSGASNREEVGMGHEGVYVMTPITALGHHNAGSQSTDGSHLGGSIGRGSSLSRTSLGGNRGSLVSMGKPTSSTLASLAGLFKERDDRSISQVPDAFPRNDEKLGDVSDTGDRDYIASRVRIIDPNLVYDGINLGRRIDVSWPTEYMRIRGGRSHWKDWVPEAGMEGPVVHKWTPSHKDPNKRSHVDRTILLVQIEDKYVPIAESGIQDLGPEV